jgi:hypothetical protein
MEELNDELCKFDLLLLLSIADTQLHSAIPEVHEELQYVLCCLYKSTLMRKQFKLLTFILIGSETCNPTNYE